MITVVSCLHGWHVIILIYVRIDKGEGEGDVG